VHILLVIFVGLLLAGVTGLTLRSVRMLMLVGVLVVALRHSRFRVRPSRIIGELFVAIIATYVASQLVFFNGRLAPREAIDAKLHIDVPFLHWITATFGTVLLVIGCIILLGVYVFATAVQYDAIEPLRVLRVSSKPIHLRIAFFSTGIVFCKRRSVLTWLRTELVCLVVLIATRAGGVSEGEWVSDKSFRRLLGPTALDWSSLAAAVDEEELLLSADVTDMAAEPASEHVVDIAGHAPH
jgi:hypothetical protein